MKFIPQEILEIDISDLREALRGLNSGKFGKNPLLGYFQTTKDGAESLRLALQNSLDYLEREESLSSKGANTAECLRMRFVEGIDEKEVLVKLHLSRAGLYRRLTEGLKRLAVILSLDRSVEGAEKTMNQASLFALPRRSTPILVGRNLLLDNVKTWLSGSNGRCLALYGAPGIGKSAITVELALDSDVRNLFSDGVVHIEVGTDADIQFIAEMCASALQITCINCKYEELEVRLKQKLSLLKVLFILDDVCSPSVWEFFNSIMGPRCAMIVSTRIYKVASFVAPNNILIIEPLTNQQSIELFAQIAPAAYSLLPGRLNAFLAQLGGLPLSIVTVARYIAQSVLRATEDEVNGAISLIEKSDGATSLGKIFDYCVARLSNSAYELLITVGSIAPKPISISERLLISISGCSVDDVSELINSNFLLSSGVHRYTVHHSFHEMALLRLRQTESDHIWQSFISHVLDELHLKKQEYIEIAQEYDLISRALAVAHTQNYSIEYAQIAVDFVPFLRSRSLIEYAIAILLESYRMVKDQHGLALEICHQLSQIYVREKDYQNAAYWAGLMIELIPSHEHKYASQAYEVLSLSAYAAGDNKKAGEYAQMAYTTGRQMGALDRFFIISSISPAQLNEFSQVTPQIAQILKVWQKGISIYKDGYMKEAQESARLSVQLSRKIENKPFLIQSLSHLCVVSYITGPYEEAVDAAVEVDEMVLTHFCDAFPQRGHSFTSSYGRIAQTLLGDYRNAMESLNKSLEYGRRHDSPDFQSMILSAMASCSFHVKNYEESYKFAQQSLAAVLQSASTDHVPSCLRACGYSAIALGRYDEAMAYLAQVEKYAVELHTPHYSKIEVGILEWRMGETEKAEQTLRETIAFLHPRAANQFLIRAEFELAKLLWMKGDEQESGLLADEALSISTSLHDIRATEIIRWIKTEDEQKFESIMDDLSGKKIN